MYIDSSTVTINGKSYTRHLLRTSYREDGKVRHQTVANVSGCSDEEIAAMKLALRHKDDLTELVSLKEDLRCQQGPSVGAVWLLFSLARELGIVEALGSDRQGKLALWQVIARAIDQGSRLSAVRLAGRHAACDVLGLDGFDEDDLYANLDWLCQHQAEIEQSLFRQRYGQTAPRLFLYDVTSSYLEGLCNQLGAFGYNRDGKKGKKQIVIGLLCDEDGLPLSVEVFMGNTGDTIALASAIRQAADRFGGGDVTFVGDRGAIRSRQIQDLASVEHGFRTCKTGHLEARPIFVRLQSRTRGHVFVVMLGDPKAQGFACGFGDPWPICWRPSWPAAGRESIRPSRRGSTTWRASASPRS